MSGPLSKMTLSRRALLAGMAALPAASARGITSATRKGRRLHIAVVGAGAFGGHAALFLRRAGARVTLVDAWGPGNSRASSGGETRVIRAVYGPDRIYVEMSARSFELWRENEARWKRKLYTRTGALWIVSDEGDYVRQSIPHLKALGFPYEELTTAEAAKRWPQIRFEGVKWAFLEKEAGYLLARRACEAVLEGFVAEGGEYRQVSARPGPIASGELRGLRLSEGGDLAADAYVFACGPWLAELFPEIGADFVQPTRQEVFYFGTPEGDSRFSEERMPVWVDLPRLFYGIPGNERRGFKIADDARGGPIDPTSAERVISAEALKSARDWIAHRFPALATAPLLESRVCQYENSPDHHFILDRHPAASNLWIVGGGSGHGFKQGPAMGERVAKTVLGQRPVDPFFGLARLANLRRVRLSAGEKERIG
ncbi:MAG TPA: FAD-dependent oxidoreductase [Thermoanaerobaculia bacterium]|nr:FAD-dependent oxidoreductase [Thermoanaerobaculia bacterium]